MDTFWIILAGILVALPCALLGCFLLLRKMTMIGDAISHAVLPGLVLGYLLTEARSPIILMIGAGFFGVLITILIELLQKKAKMQTESSIGISFTFLFAVGIILIAAFAGKIDLDQDCVLYGDIGYITLKLGFWNIPTTILTSGVWFLVVLIFILVNYTRLWITTFDENYAKVIGISVAFSHYSLMSAVSFTVVLSFEAVGAILVIAFLVVPAATAYLVSKKMNFMLFFSALISVVGIVMGYFLAVVLNASIAGSMAVCLGFLFILTLFYSQIKKYYLKNM
ncbi:MAG: metal ABC transporter permease [Bacteroidetes bacterium]|nr:MAG: metal ABC transporter permease [Bacteroidota bacterium]TAG92920.1 MAG: metal ABC transporter permease [Bacteroidota bacterium]